VGDDPNVLIVNADTGEILQELTGHGDYGFACDWSDDGWTVATGFQDKAIKIWDARKWCNSSGVSTALCTIRAEMAGVRGLRFSPRGSGKPILVAAEEADYINLIDAQTFSSKQTIDVFSEVGGIDFTNDGQDLNVLCCDPHRGGVLQLERCGRGPDVSLENAWLRRSTRYPWLVDRDEECELQQRWSRDPARRPGAVLAALSGVALQLVGSRAPYPDFCLRLDTTLPLKPSMAYLFLLIWARL